MVRQGGENCMPKRLPIRLKVGTALAVLALLTLTGCQATTKAEGLREGSPAPAFELEAVGGKRVSLQQYRGKQPVLLFFSMGPG
jgi:cytochrome oxidase Cu insertion factor (SCO1/SenC/PrrC family)